DDRGRTFDREAAQNPEDWTRPDVAPPPPLRFLALVERSCELVSAGEAVAGGLGEELEDHCLEEGGERGIELRGRRGDLVEQVLHHDAEVRGGERVRARGQLV